MSQIKENVSSEPQIFSGNVIIFHAFDVGDDIDIEWSIIRRWRYARKAAA